MPRQYHLKDAELWAAFSGDNNPIHFNLTAARQLGLDRLCIHGMRAMLDIKASLASQAWRALPQAQSLLFSCRLDKPVFYQQSYLLQMEQISRNKRLQLRCTLCDAASQEVSISGKLVAESTLEQCSAGEDGQISPQEMTLFVRQLSAMTGQKFFLWNALDAVLFKQLIQSPATMYRVREVLHTLDCPDLMSVFNQIQMVQTHHETHFAPCLLALDDIATFTKSLSFSILPALVVGKSDAGFILRVSIQASAGKKALMTTSVTLKATLFTHNPTPKTDF